MLSLKRFPHLPVSFGGPNHRIIDSGCFIEGARHVERKAVLIYRKGPELRIHYLARRSKRVLKSSPLRHRHFGYAVQRRDEIPGHGQSLEHGLPAVERITTSWSNRFRIELPDCIEGLRPGAKMSVAAVAGGVILYEVSREHNSGVRHPRHDVTRRVTGTELHQLHLALAKEERHFAFEGERRPS